MKDKSNKDNELSDKEIKSLLYSTKKTTIVNSPLKPRPSLEINEESAVFKNSFEFHKMKAEYFPYFLMINFLYIFEFQETSFNASYKFFKEILIADGVKKKQLPPFKKIAKTTREIIKQRDELDQKIKSRLVKWELERLSLIKKTILRWGIFFLLEERELPKNKVMLYAVKFAQWLGEKKDYQFINGLLEHFYEKES